jgi:hypothetical protein
MAETTNTINTKITLDSTEAQIEIARLNGIAGDSTESLKTRVAAKNKQVKLQNDLSKKTVKALEEEVKSLTGVTGKEKDLEKAVGKLNKAKIKEATISARNEKIQKKLNESYSAGSSTIGKLDKATNGLIGRLTLLATNPIVLVVTLLVGAFNLLKEAFQSSEEGQNRYLKLMDLIDTMLGNLLDIVADFSDVLINAWKKPEEAFESFKGVLMSGFEVLKLQIYDRWKANITLLASGFEKGMLKMRIAWNDFTGDSEESKKLTFALEEVNKKIEEALDVHDKANDQIISGIKAIAKAGADLADDITKDNKDSKIASDKRAAADVIERQLIIDKSIQLAKVADLRLKSRQEDKFSNEQRKQFLLDAQAAEASLLSEQLKAAKLRRDAQAIENTFSRTNKENKDKLAQLEANVNNVLAERANLGRQIQREVTRIDGQMESDRIKRFNDEIARDKAIINSKEKGSKERYDLNVALLKRLRESELQELYLQEEDKIAIREKYNALETDAYIKQEQFKIDQKYANAERDLEAQIAIDETNLEYQKTKDESTLAAELALIEARRKQAVKEEGLRVDEINAINVKAENDSIILKEATAKTKEDVEKALFKSNLQLAADSFGVAKELALAEMLIAAPRAIGSVWKNAADKKTIPGIIAHGVIGTAAVVGPIYKTIKDIKKASMPKGGKASGSTSPASAPTGAGTSDINSLAANNISRLGGDPSLISNASSDAVNSTQTTGTNGLIIFSESSYQDFQDQITFRNNTTSI